MKKLLFLGFFFFSPLAFSAEIPDESRFEFFREVKIQGITTPKVVRVEIPEEIRGETILVNEQNIPLAHEILRERENLPTPSFVVQSVSSSFEGDKNMLADGIFDNAFAFALENDPDKNVIFEFQEKSEISDIEIVLDSGVIPPQKISVFADFGDGNFQKMMDRQNFSSFLKIPKIAPQRLKISFGLENTIKKPNAVIFFAEEGKIYRLFTNPHFGAKLPQTEYQPLSADEKTPNFTFGEAQKNPSFNPDFDKDGIPDNTDLCPRDADSTNADIDQNGRGDFCEDPDLDDIPSARDNCPFVANADQSDQDSDQIGDKCDTKESRFSENHPEILWAMMAGMILLLGMIMWRVANKKENSDS